MEETTLTETLTSVGCIAPHDFEGAALDGRLYLYCRRCGEVRDAVKELAEEADGA